MIITKLGNCALCGKEDVQLECSHIIPQFVIRYLKRISIGKLRTIGKPNSVSQDSEKHYLLCGECEDRFSTTETLFAEKVFRPFQQGKFTSIKYGQWLHYFLTSLSWRSLVLDIKFFEDENKIHEDDLDLLKKSEKIMKKYLLGKSPDICDIEHHLFFFEDIMSIPREYKQLPLHMAIQGTQGGYTIHNHEAGTHATFTNMMGILLFTIYSFGKDEKWENTKISEIGGVISAGNQYITSTLGMEIEHLASSLIKAQSELSEDSKLNIEKTIIKNSDKIQQSKLYKIKIKDLKLK